jgi:23S rRNA pseudouridine1911/1915/1917 synthase
MMFFDVNILYEDKDIIVVEKPYGVSSQTERGTSQDMVSMLMNYFYENTAEKSKAPYVGVVHRLDKNVGGVMVYGKTKAAAAKLSSQISERSAVKKYFAVFFCPERIEKEGCMSDFLIRDGRTNTSRVASETERNCSEAKKAELTYKIIGEAKLNTAGEKNKNANFIQAVKNGEANESTEITAPHIGLADISLGTGRHHQIRVQFAHRGCPLVGDRKYGAEENRDIDSRNVALYCYSMTIKHPATGKIMTFENKPQTDVFKIFDV